MKVRMGGSTRRHRSVAAGDGGALAASGEALPAGSAGRAGRARPRAVTDPGARPTGAEHEGQDMSELPTSATPR